MSTNQKHLNTAIVTQATNYLPAVFRECKAEWFVEYYIENPITHQMERKKIKVNRLANRYPNKKEARKHINNMVTSINIKLASGWTPFFESEDARLYTPIKVALDAFIAEKTKELRSNSMRSYNSFVTIFSNWLISTNPNLYSAMFSHSFAIRFMDYVYTERGVKQVAYNNYLKMAKAIFNWMVEKCYTKENPFGKIKPKAKPTKTRILIPSEARVKIITHLRIVNPHFLLVCKLMYYSLIRPKEILSIRIEDVNIVSKTIRITEDNAKNGKQRYCALTQDIIDDLMGMNILEYPSKHFLFGLNLTPCITPSGDARLRKEWDKVRNALKLPKAMQLYSFRDTGITEMLKNGIDDLTVMQHADHHSLEMTTKYSSHADPNLVNIIYERSPQF